jgi:hypothetical protein
MRIGAVVVVIWLIIGAIAAGQRGYFSGDRSKNCAQASTTVVAIIAGPLNYMGLNPKVHCDLPQPSK